MQLHPNNILGGAAGYVSSCDRRPTPENYFAGGWFCTRSNEAEITYILRPETYGIGIVYHRSRRFLKASPISALIGNPNNNSNQSTYYGASWLFHRYLADQYASGNASPFFRQLNDGTYLAGSEGIRDATGVHFSKILNEFMHAIMLQGELSGFETTPYSFSSLQFKDISSYFITDDTPREWPYLQKSLPFQSGSFTIKPLIYTSPVFYEFIANGRGDVVIELFNENENQLNPSHDMSIKIVTIK